MTHPGAITGVCAYIGLGSNLAAPIDQVERAFTELARLPESRLVSRSRLYRSLPMGPLDQPDYVNAVAKLKTALEPHALLDGLQAIERRHQRDRSGQRWGPRTLDLDLLLFGDRVIHDDRLEVPHPGLHARAFVLYPLAELAPDLTIPGRGALAELLARCPAEGLEPLGRNHDR